MGKEEISTMMMDSMTEDDKELYTPDYILKMLKDLPAQVHKGYMDEIKNAQTNENKKQWLASIVKVHSRFEFLKNKKRLPTQLNARTIDDMRKVAQYMDIGE